jgi:O-glycosyl hydrolase
MSAHRIRAANALTVLFLILAGLSLTAARAADVVIDPSQTFQTIEGWGTSSDELGGQCGANVLQFGQAIADPVNHQLIDYLTDDLGLTGSRITELGTRLDGGGNDHGDCDAIDWTLFQPGFMAAINGPYMTYFANRVRAEGCQPCFYSSTGYASLASDHKPWVLHHPGERAQRIWSSALYWKRTFGIDVNYVVIVNEPGSGDGWPWTPPMLADAIKALGPRLAAHGLATKIQYDEGVSPQSAWNQIVPLQNDAEIWPCVGRLSYHHYGTADPYRCYIRDFGRLKGIRTAQTEMDPNHVNDLYEDLTSGGVSYWETSFSFSNLLRAGAGHTSYTPAGSYFPLRQVLHYVRPGAVRIGAASSDPSLRVLAFARGGRETVIFWNNTGGPAQTVELRGLVPGTYGLSQARLNGDGVTTPDPSFEELGVQTVGTAGKLTLGLRARVVATLYPRPATNLPPTIISWRSSPGCLSSPASKATLSVTANDPDLDPLSYAWSVVSQPPGAGVLLEKPGAAATAVTGLTAGGTYVFNVDVRDGANTVSKRVYLVVYGSNQPPLVGAGFRLGAPYGLALDYPGAATQHVYVTLPTPSVILQANVNDLENDPLTGAWSLVSQPAGAAAALGKTSFIYSSFRATPTGMTVAGDYVFQVSVSDPTHTVTRRAICSVGKKNTPPVINSIAASPTGLTLPASTTRLAAATSDAEGDLLRHWWAVKSAPSGARPVFDHQGLSTTTVSNLLIPGTYQFTLRCFDDIHMTTRDVTVTVSPAP